jgi:exodeoxyribonuclease VII large subunit
LKEAATALTGYRQRVKNLHPTTILNKGFAIVKMNNKIITNPQSINPSDEIQVILKNETIFSTITKKSTNEPATNI